MREFVIESEWVYELMRELVMKDECLWMNWVRGSPIYIAKGEKKYKKNKVNKYFLGIK